MLQPPAPPPPPPTPLHMGGGHILARLGEQPEWSMGGVAGSFGLCHLPWVLVSPCPNYPSLGEVTVSGGGLLQDFFFCCSSQAAQQVALSPHTGA